MKTIIIATSVLCLCCWSGCSDSDDGGGTNPPTPPDTPTGLAVTGSSPLSLTLTWDAVDGADEYRLYRAASGSALDTAVYTGPLTDFIDVSLDCGAAYDYQVTAANDGGESDRSATATSSTDVPTGYQVAGSPAGGVDATYNYLDDFNGHPRYQSVPIGLNIVVPSGGDHLGQWCIFDQIEGVVLFYNPTAGDYPPRTGWLRALDDSPTTILLTPFII